MIKLIFYFFPKKLIEFFPLSLTLLFLLHLILKPILKSLKIIFKPRE